MTVDEVSNLKTEILFGSSHCSCTSCDTIRCFTKRNFIGNECHCPICNEPTTCMYNIKSLPAKVAMKASGSRDGQKANKQVKVCPSPNIKRSVRRNVPYNRSFIDIKVVKKSVCIQTLPQASDKVNSALVDILQKLLANYQNASIQSVVGKIADICATCSCKVCDCVLSSARGDCDCKPCECADCTTALTPNALPYRAAYTCNNVNSPPFDTRCNNQKRDNDNLASIKEYGPCDCKPCDCNECKIYNFNIKDEGHLRNFKISMPQKHYKDKIISHSKGSSCKFFQCPKCKSMLKPSKAVIVAPVTECPQLNSCSCSPCDCENCRVNRSSVSARAMREISTGMVQNSNCKCTQCLNQRCRQATSSCHCENRNSVINKPFDNNDQNIDIHSALIEKTASELSGAASTLTDVILGLIEENVKKINYESVKDNLNCESKHEASASKSASFCHTQKLSSTPLNNRRVNQCQCNPCECKICDNFKGKGNEQSVWKSEVFRSKCDCEICRCLYCGDLLQFRDVGDNNNIGQVPTNNCKANKSSNNRDRSVYLALLHDVYSRHTIPAKGNKYEMHNYLHSDKVARVQNASNNLPNHFNENKLSSFYSSFSVSRHTRNETKHDALSLENQSHESIEKHVLNYQEVLKNDVVKTFVSKVAKRDEKSDFNFVMQRTRKDKEKSNKYESSAFFAETLKTQSGSETGSDGQPNEMSNESVDHSISRTKCETKQSEIIFFKNNFIQIVHESLGKTNLALKDYEKDIHNVDIGDISEGVKTLGSKLNANDDIIDKPVDEAFLPTTGNYLEKHNILFRAKLLTYELLKMLYQCQKAHKEFKSVTENLNIKCDPDPKKDDTIHRKTVEFSDKINVSSSDSICSWMKVANPNDKREAGFETENKSKGNMVNFYNLPNSEIKQSRTNSKLYIHDVLKNEISVHVSENFVTVNEFTNTTNRVKCASHLTTIFKKAISKTTSKKGPAKLILCPKTWNLNKKGETANNNKIKYSNVNNTDKNKRNKKQYILIENMVTKVKEYKSVIN